MSAIHYALKIGSIDYRQRKIRARARARAQARAREIMSKRGCRIVWIGILL